MGVDRRELEVARETHPDPEGHAGDQAQCREQEKDDVDSRHGPSFMLPALLVGPSALIPG